MAGHKKIRISPLSRMSNEEYKELTAKYRRKCAKNRTMGCVGRLSQNDYEKSFNKTYNGLGFNRNKVTSDDA